MELCYLCDLRLLDYFRDGLRGRCDICNGNNWRCGLGFWGLPL